LIVSTDLVEPNSCVVFK